MAKQNKVLSKTDQFEVNGKAAYLYVPHGTGRSKPLSNIQACLSTRVTARNLNATNKILQLLEKP